MADDDKIENRSAALLMSADRALINAAAAEGKEAPGVVQLTPSLLKQIAEDLQRRADDQDKRYPQLVADCPYETRLAVTAWVFENIVAHAREGGTFRYLIYERLGFNHDAYVPLYRSGGMTISNEFSLKEADGADDGAVG